MMSKIIRTQTWLKTFTPKLKHFQIVLPSFELIRSEFVVEFDSRFWHCADCSCRNVKQNVIVQMALNSNGMHGNELYRKMPISAKFATNALFKMDGSAVVRIIPQKNWRISRQSAYKTMNKFIRFADLFSIGRIHSTVTTNRKTIDNQLWNIILQTCKWIHDKWIER